MLRVNSHTAWRVRQFMRRWNRIPAWTPKRQHQNLTASQRMTWWLARRLYQWLASPARKLPTSLTLAQLAGDGLAEYKDDADNCLSAFAAQAEDRGTRSGFARTAAHGGQACSPESGATTLRRPRSSGSRRHWATRPMTTGALAASTGLNCPPSQRTSRCGTCAGSCCPGHGS